MTNGNKATSITAREPTPVLCTVTLDAVDALAFAHTVRTVARDKRTPHGVRELFTAVGSQILSAAKLELQQRRLDEQAAKRTERAA